MEKPKDQCNSCSHIGKGWGHEHCRYLTFAPSKPCTHNSFQPVTSAAKQLERCGRAQPPEMLEDQPERNLEMVATPVGLPAPARRPPLTLEQIQQALGVQVEEGSMPCAIARAIDRFIP